MTATIIITFCALLLIAYIFDITSSKTKIPSVILLLALGWVLKISAGLFRIPIPDLEFILPLLGTAGLVLIVLDGSLDLELDKSKFVPIARSFAGATFSVLAVSFILAWLFAIFSATDFRQALINAIPISIISSAIAIPSTKHLCRKNKEFVVYDTSFSDVMGVIFFTFITINYVYTVESFLTFGLQMLQMLFISIIATAILSFLLSRMKHQIKFIPIILLVMLIYSLAELFHLPALIFILLFGIAIGNLDKIIAFQFINTTMTDSLEKEVTRFKQITTELTFLIRSLFFMVFGFMIETKDILDFKSLIWAIVIISIALGIRTIQLKLTKQKLMPLLFILPRGLITILLFMSIAPELQISFVTRNLILQIIVISTLIMTIGTATSGKANKAGKASTKDKTNTVDKTSTAETAS